VTHNRLLIGTASQYHCLGGHLELDHDIPKTLLTNFPMKSHLVDK